MFYALLFSRIFTYLWILPQKYFYSRRMVGIIGVDPLVGAEGLDPPIILLAGTKG